MKLRYAYLVYFFLLLLFVSSTFAGGLTWLEPKDPPRIIYDFDKPSPTPPPREFFSFNRLYLGAKIYVNVGYDVINNSYVVMPSPNVQKVVKVGNKQRVTIQQYFPNLEDKILDSYHIPANKLSYLYLTGYEVYDQDEKLISRIAIPAGVQYIPPQVYTFDVPDTVTVLSFVYTFNGRTAWSDTGMSTDLQGLYRNIADIGVDRDSAIYLETNPGSGLKAYEVLTSNENQKIQKILTDFHHIVVWGRMTQKQELIDKIIDLKNFQELDIDLAKGVESLEKYPLIFGDPLKWQSILNHITSERLTEKEMNSEGSISTKLGLRKFFSFEGSGSSKRNSRFKEIVKFDAVGTFYIPKALKFATRTNESFEVLKSLVFQAYDHLEEASFRIGTGVSLDQKVPRVMSDRLLEGEQLEVGDSITSNNGKYTLVLQADGNLVLYQIGENLHQALWSTNTGGRAASRCIMQSDGNFVLYAFPGAIWDSHTYDHPGAFLVLLDDGNLVIYQNQKIIWTR